MSRAASRPKRGAILNFKPERAAVLKFKRTAALNSKPERAAALNFKSEQNASLNFTPEQSSVLNFNRASLNFRSRRDEFYLAFLLRGSCGAAVLSNKILRPRGKNFKACGKSGGAKFLKPKFRGERKEGYDAKYR